MKKLFTTTLLAAAITSPAAMAENTELKQGAIFFATTISGAALGGPVGMIIGAVSGAYLGEKVKQADEAKQTEHTLTETEAMVSELQQQLVEAESQMKDLRQVALQKLEFAVLFPTGQDVLSTQGQEKISALAEFLSKNPKLNVHLDGHTDPRGTDEYNNVLSQHRALSVKQALEAAGVESSRITYSGHGSDYSTAKKGDTASYALERRVDIDVYEDSGLALIP